MGMVPSVLLFLFTVIPTLLLEPLIPFAGTLGPNLFKGMYFDQS